MHRIALILLFALLMACDTPGRGFGGLPAERVDVGGAVFDLRRRGDVVEAVRRSVHGWPRYDWVADRAALAAFQSTGCRPAWALGDPSVVRLGLSCEGRRPPPVPKARETLYCDVTAYRIPRTDMAQGTMVCS